jgi:DHA1 family bicyclomycin/chloramphenicol resistance-like MFS transporter
MTTDVQEAAIAEAPPARGLVLVLVIGSLSAFGPLSVDAYLPGLPALGRDLGASASATQATITGCLVGLAAGQLLVGPVSDALGRRRPLLAGIAVYVVASVLCAVAPSIAVLVVARVLQGLAGAAGIVIARAVVRDLFGGVAAAQFFALLMLVTTLAPIIAPILGAQILRVGTWRTIFYAVAAVGALIFAGAAAALPETLPGDRRRRGGFRELPGAFRFLLRDRAFVAHVLGAGFPFAAMFAYIAGSSFVLEEVYGLSPQRYGIVFGANAFGIMLFSQVSRALVPRLGSRRLLLVGLVLGACGSGLFLACALASLGLAVVLPSLFLAVGSVGLVLPNAAALALADHPQLAGTASAVLGVSQFALGAAIAPLVGSAGARTAVPMAIVMAAFAAAGLVDVLFVAPRPHR